MMLPCLLPIPIFLYLLPFNTLCRIIVLMMFRYSVVLKFNEHPFLLLHLRFVPSMLLSHCIYTVHAHCAFIMIVSFHQWQFSLDACMSLLFISCNVLKFLISTVFSIVNMNESNEQIKLKYLKYVSCPFPFHSEHYTKSPQNPPPHNVHNYLCMR